MSSRLQCLSTQIEHVAASSKTTVNNMQWYNCWVDPLNTTVKWSDEIIWCHWGGVHMFVQHYCAHTPQTSPTQPPGFCVSACGWMNTILFWNMNRESRQLSLTQGPLTSFSIIIQPHLQVLQAVTRATVIISLLIIDNQQIYHLIYKMSENSGKWLFLRAQDIHFTMP